MFLFNFLNSEVFNPKSLGYNLDFINILSFLIYNFYFIYKFFHFYYYELFNVYLFEKK